MKKIPDLDKFAGHIHKLKEIIWKYNAEIISAKEYAEKWFEIKMPSLPDVTAQYLFEMIEKGEHIVDSYYAMEEPQMADILISAIKEKALQEVKRRLILLEEKHRITDIHLFEKYDED